MRKLMVFTAGCICVLGCRREVTMAHRSDAAGIAVDNINAGGAPWSVVVGLVSTMSTSAAIHPSSGIASDAAGNTYFCEGNVIKLVSSSGTVSVFAGDGFAGFKEGAKLSAEFNGPTGLAFDKAGNLFVADQNNQRIRIISSDGNVSTYAGSGAAGFADGPGETARFNQPSSVAVDQAGTVYVSDMFNNRIRKISVSRVVNSWAGSGVAGYKDAAGALAQFNDPSSITVTRGGTLYVVELFSQRIRKIVAGVVTTLAGNGQAGYVDASGTEASFAYPAGIAVDAAGNLFVADGGNNRIRKVEPSGMVSTIAGSSSGFVDGSWTAAKFYNPAGLTIDPNGVLIVADLVNAKLRRVNLVPAILRFAGTGDTGYRVGRFDSAVLGPGSVALDGNENVYTIDFYNHISKITQDGHVSLLAGSGVDGYADGPGPSARFNAAGGLLADAAGNVFVADAGNHRIRKVAPDGMVSTYAGNGIAGNDTGAISGAVIDQPIAMAFDAAHNMLISGFSNKIRRITADGRIHDVATLPTPRYPDVISYGIGADAANNIYVTDIGNEAVYKVSPSGVVRVFATQEFWQPFGLAVDNAHGNVYITDVYNYYVYVYSLSGQFLERTGPRYDAAIGWVLGPESIADFKAPHGIAIGASRVYVADAGHRKVLMFSRR